MAFRLLDHTADLGIAAEAATAGEALAEAALGLTSVLTGRPHPRTLGPPQREVTFTVEAPDLPALAVAFLSELLWLNASQDLLWVGGGVEVTTPGTYIIEPSGGGVVRATAKGNALTHDPVRHGRGVEVKAVTYHDVAFERHGEGWTLRVLLDI